MNLFELFVKIGVDDQASKNLSSISSKLGNGLKAAAKAGTAAIASASAGIAALTTAAVKNYAEYEQLVGGVDTLFKSSSQKVQEYAANAFRTAGMSANEYMSTVTSFSASLLQSLGGDTEAAAEYANQALTDMSDNANKMGTSMEMIQNAYQGFAKQNYSMLDNLKLGYGGTASEMYRLLQRAAELDETFAQTADFSIDEKGHLTAGFADITQAIHIVQTEMGITGTTAKEAASTISGSVGMVKASWSNLTVAIADENSDAQKSIDNFVDSVGVAAGNLLPRVEVALNGITNLVDSLIPKIVERMPEYISKYAPKLIQSGANILKSLVGGIKKNAKVIVGATKEIVFSITENLVDLVPEVIDAGVELLSGLVEAIPEVAVELATQLPKLVTGVAKSIASGAVKVAGAAHKMFSPVSQEAEKAVEGLEKLFIGYSPFVDTLENTTQKTVDLSNALSANGNTISELDDKIEEVEGKITAILKDQFSKQQKLRSEDIQNIENYQKRIKELNDEKLGIYRDQQLAELRKAQLEISDLSESDAATIITAATSAFKESNRITEEIYSDRLLMIENMHKAAGTIGSKAYQEDLQNAKNQHKEMLEENERYYQETLGIVSSGSEAWLKEDAAKWGNLRNVILDYSTKRRNDPNAYWLDTFNKGHLDYGTFDAVIGEYAKLLGAIDPEATASYLAAQSEVVESGKELSGDAMSNIQNIFRSFSDLPPELQETGKTALLGIVEGFEEKIPELKEVGEMTASEIANAALEYFSSNQSYSGAPFVYSYANKYARNTALPESSGTNIGNVNINIDGAAYTDPEELAESVAYSIQQMIIRKGVVYG